MGCNDIGITGKRFGKLVALRNTYEKKHFYYIWEFECDCGNTHFTGINLVLRKGTRGGRHV